MTRRTFLRKLVSGLAVAEGTALLATLYPLLIEPNWMDVTRVRISIPNLPDDLQGLRIVQFSDVHLGPYMHRSFLRRSVRAIMSLSPDLIVFTGDMVSRDVEANPEDAQLLAPLSARLGVWGVLGNHDHWSDPDFAHEFIERNTPIRILRNQSMLLRVGGSDLYLVGVDDAWVGADDADKAFHGVPEDAVRLVLMHEPDAVEWLPMSPSTLQLSGHTHGGQVRLPFAGALLLPYLGRKYDVGLYRVRGGWLYVNRGLGVIAPPLRLNCRPEITLFVLQKAPMFS